MKRSLIFLFILTSLVVSGCSTEAAENVADEFHKNLDKGNYDFIVDSLAYIDEATTEKDWSEFLSLVATWGPQKNREKKMGFSKKINNGMTTVKLSYTFEIEGTGLMHERIVLLNTDNGYKILRLMMNADEDLVEEGTKNF